MLPAGRLAAAVEARLPFAERLFDAVRAETADAVGVTRPAWSAEDGAAARIVAEAARGLGLEVGYDLAGNLRCALPGADRGAPGVLTGSHLDSVPTGGHYDGLAGVVAGLTALAAFRDLGAAPACDLTVAGLRGEESVWYGVAYVGSRLAVGALPPEDLDRLRRGDTGRTLAEHMAEAGVDVAALRAALAAPGGSAGGEVGVGSGPGAEAGSASVLSPENTRAFLELHIEQGPVLVGEGLPVGVPTTIRGNVRFPYARCTGRYGHSGATPREWRRDAALAVVELVRALDELWIEREAGGVPDTVFTVGKLFTDPAHHAMTKVPGRCDFTLNFGGTTSGFLDECRERTRSLAERIGRERRGRVRARRVRRLGTDPPRPGASRPAPGELRIARPPGARVRHRRPRRLDLRAGRDPGRHGAGAERPREPQPGRGDGPRGLRRRDEGAGRRDGPARGLSRRAAPRSSTPAPGRGRPLRRPAHAPARDRRHNRPMRFFNTEGPIRPDDGDRWRGRLAIPRGGIAGAPGRFIIGPCASSVLQGRCAQTNTTPCRRWTGWTSMSCWP